MMADDQALQGPPPHLANGSRGRSQVLPYQPHGFTQGIWGIQSISGILSPPPRTAGGASFFRSRSGEGLSELVMEFPAVLRVFPRHGKPCLQLAHWNRSIPIRCSSSSWQAGQQKKLEKNWCNQWPSLILGHTLRLPPRQQVALHNWVVSLEEKWLQKQQNVGIPWRW